MSVIIGQREDVERKPLYALLGDGLYFTIAQSRNGLFHLMLSKSSERKQIATYTGTGK